MKFIFPKNYKYRAKILGFIDYSTAVVDLIIGIILFLFLKIFVKKISTRIYIFIILFVPIILFSIFVADGENIIVYLVRIIRFMKRRGVYFYSKNNYEQHMINGFKLNKGIKTVLKKE